MNNPNSVPSPCTHVCVRDKNDVCIGCFRSLEEIRGWWKFTDDQKKQALTNAEKRRHQKEANDRFSGYA